MLFPDGGSVGCRLSLFPPVHAVVVSLAPDEIVAAVAVDVHDQKRGAGPLQSRFRMELPWPGEGVAFRALVPADRTEDVFPAVAVDVAEGIAVAAAPLAQHDPLCRRLAVRRLGQFPG